MVTISSLGIGIHRRSQSYIVICVGSHDTASRRTCAHLINILSGGTDITRFYTNLDIKQIKFSHTHQVEVLCG